MPEDPLRSEPGPAARTSWWARFRALLSLGLLCGLIVSTTAARWTDEATATATFSTGSIDLRLGAARVEDAPAETTTLTVPDMVPGSTVTALLPVSNVGTHPLAYSMTTEATGALAPALRLSVYAGGSCGGTALVDGVPPASATFTGRALSAAGDSTPTETLCLRVTLPADAEGSRQGTTAQATFRFTAESR